MSRITFLYKCLQQGGGKLEGAWKPIHLVSHSIKGNHMRALRLAHLTTIKHSLSFQIIIK